MKLRGAAFSRVLLECLVRRKGLNEVTPEQFCYWLQGFAELRENGGNSPTAEQWKLIREHLATVFNKVTPPLLTQPSATCPAVPVDMSLVC